MARDGSKVGTRHIAYTTNEQCKNDLGDAKITSRNKALFAFGVEEQWHAVDEIDYGVGPLHVTRAHFILSRKEETELFL